MELHSMGGARSTRFLSDDEPGNWIGSGAGAAEDISVERTSSFQAAAAASLALGVLAAGTLVLGLFVREWQQETAYRARLLLACLPSLSFASKQA